MANQCRSSSGCISGNGSGIIIILILRLFILSRLTGRHVNVSASTSANENAAQARTLLFPPTAPTRIQFIGGIGIPVEDLNFESITSGYVLKAEYFLPTEAHEWQKTYLRPQTIHRRSLNESNASMMTKLMTAKAPLSKQQQQLPQRTQEPQFKYKYNHEHEHKRKRNESTKFAVNEQDQQLNVASLYRWIIYQGIEQLLQRAGQPGRQCMLRSICEHAAVPLHFDSGILAEVLHIILSPSSSQEALIKVNDAVYFEAERLGRANAECAHIYRGCHQSPMDYISTIFDID